MSETHLPKAERPIGVSSDATHPCMSVADHDAGWWQDADSRWWLCQGFTNPSTDRNTQPEGEPE